MDRYLDELRSGLERDCGKRAARPILVEVRSHLSDGVEELLSQGLSREDAEERALTRFGHVDAVRKWYAEQHGRPSIWRASLWPLTTLAAILLLELFRTPIVLRTFLIPHSIFVLAGIVIAVPTIACYCSRRFTSGVILLASGALFTLLLGSFCLFSIPISEEVDGGLIARWSIRDHIQDAKKDIAYQKWELARLDEGRRLFANPREPKGGLGTFKDSRGYVTWIYLQTQDPRFRETESVLGTRGIFATYQEARSVWLSESLVTDRVTGAREPFYVWDVREPIYREQRFLRDVGLAAALPLGAKIRYFAVDAQYLPTFVAQLGVTADLFGGLIRIVVLAWRRRRRPEPLVR
ncbi:MAG: permease prefix domain 1-containing protein [Fimbriimonas sp.]|nr:permease prefix domain 1-containing protein [Fimbriimonas sp.]